MRVGLLLRFLFVRFDIHGLRSHRVLDGDLGADFKIAGDLRIRRPGDLPLLLPFCTTILLSDTSSTGPVT